MLGLLGIFGAVFAGFMADGVLNAESKMKSDDEDDGPDTRSPSNEEGADHGFLDFLDTAPTTAPTIDGLAEDDMLDSDSTDMPPPAPDNRLIFGADDDDILTGDTGADAIFGGNGGDLLGGRDGDDVIDGGEGEDHIDGGSGADSLRGGAGDDVLQGLDGDDEIEGSSGDDWLAGHMDDDLLQGDEGADSLMGGSGDDTLIGGEDDDWLAGGYGDDALQGRSGSDTLDGNAGNDTLLGVDPENPKDSDGADFLNGGTGDDTLLIGAGDYAHGGEGADTFALGDWIGDGEVAHISDYNPDEDDIVVLYDATAHPDPHIALISEDGSNDATVLLDGIPLAVIANGAGLSVDALKLMPSNSF